MAKFSIAATTICGLVTLVVTSLTVAAALGAFGVPVPLALYVLTRIIFIFMLPTGLFGILSAVINH